LENIVTEIGPGSTFRGLPLTQEQDAEIRHYIKGKKQRREPWSTPELEAMLKDMLEPPSAQDNEFVGGVEEANAAAERATATIDEAMEPIEAIEEWTAAMESEGMKGPKR
jgi:hypothetical protein